MSYSNEKIDAATKMLREQGHTVKKQVRGDNLWFEVDQRMLVSGEEMQNLADGVYSLAELEELFRRRRADGAGGRADELAQEVVNTYAGLGGAGHAANLTPDFKALVDRAFEYQIAKRDADSQRATLRLVLNRADDREFVLDSLPGQAASREHDAREKFVDWYKEFWEKNRQREAQS